MLRKADLGAAQKGHTAACDGPPDEIGVFDSHVSSSRTGIRSAVVYPGRLLGTKARRVIEFQDFSRRVEVSDELNVSLPNLPRYAHGAYICRVLQRFLVVKETQIVRGQIGHGYRVAIVSVLEHDADTIGSVGQNVQYACLEERDPAEVSHAAPLPRSTRVDSPVGSARLTAV
jgi:hypothetical protein